MMVCWKNLTNNSLKMDKTIFNRNSTGTKGCKMKIHTYWDWEQFIFGITVVHFNYVDISVGFHIGFFEIDIEIPKKKKDVK